MTDTRRRDEVAANLDVVRRRIASACESAGRSPDDVSLVVVTKFFPADDVRLLADLGVTDVGENRHQEAEAKAAECADLGLRWHFIGGLQSNKAAAVASYADEAVGVMAPDAQGRLVVSVVTLRPHVVFDGGRQPDAAALQALHHRAHESCFLANSVKTEIRCEPSSALAPS